MARLAGEEARVDPGDGVLPEWRDTRIARDFWLSRIHCAWERAPIVWLASLRRVGKTSLAKMLSHEGTLTAHLVRPYHAGQARE